VGVHFQVVVYKELITFPSEWEAWKRFLQGVVSSQVCKSVLQVLKFQSFKFKVCERKVLKVS